MAKGKSINALMKHLRTKHGIEIQGSRNKRDLMNMGYFHGFKGYRFIGQPNNIIPFQDFDELVAINKFDTQIKSLLYPHIMFIETALKNYTLNSLIANSPSDFEYIFTHLLVDYKAENVGNNKYRDKMKKRLDLKNKILSSIAYNYADGKDVIKHYLHNNKQVPLWAIFEVISMGEFGFLLQCLDRTTRIRIAEDLGLHTTSHNQNGRIPEDIIFLIKELRNAVAHNGVVFDCRFKKTNPPSRVIEYLQSETAITNIHFNHIIDYLIVMIILLKKLSVTKNEIKKVLKDLENYSEHLRDSIPTSIHTSIMGSDFRSKLEKLRTYI
ncbi:Abi family protein [Sporosarcina thermotolerans]|uniref:Abi family protein n=1 Tax=Sporosarcina thermotolerans TaxID=633404 RepID=A0AAW9ACQ0_9BACL|nr:Abi family protein [Sporosarcina thermotolerans]MDW0117979.1 Abi family protein [Sporosarcina thermotolerans]WHT49057.1 Abi family protein [Sporosarcina thermotolerans]